jgi:hypothetical protein
LRRARRRPARAFAACARRSPDAGRRSPRRRDQPGGQQLGQHPCVELVGLDLGVADRPQPLRVRQHHLGHMWHQDPGDPQRVARGLPTPRGPSARGWRQTAPGAHSEPRPYPPISPARPSLIATSQKSRWTSNPMNLLTPIPPQLARQRTGDGGRTTPTDSRSQRTRASRRGGQLHQRARSP